MDVIIELYRPERVRLAGEHRYYVDQSKQRVLFSLDDNQLNEEVEKSTEEYIQEFRTNSDPDADPASFYEDAYDHAIYKTIMLTELRQHTLLSVTAGMYHLWEKKFRALVHHDLSLNFPGDRLSAQIWKVDISKLIELLGSFGWSSLPLTYEKIIQCGLIVNVFKHGNGRSLEALKLKYPQFLKKLDPDFSNFPQAWDYLEICDEQLDDFADAIEEFWLALPENLTSTDAENSLIEAPQCFCDALKADQKTKYRNT